MIPVLIVPILNQPELLYRMLDSVDVKVGTLVVIDNGHCLPGDFPRRNWARNAYLLRMPANLGVAGSWNLGIKATPMAPWWMVANFDVVFPPGALAQFDRPDSPEALVLSGGSPDWCVFTVGERVVERVGLFDEALYPAYWEDLDYERRCEAAGVPIIRSGISVHHDNSSTLQGGYRAANERTFGDNAAYYAEKVQRHDLTDGRWSLPRRRALTWD